MPCVFFVYFFPSTPKFLYPSLVDCCTISFSVLCEPTSIPGFAKEYCRSSAIFRKHPLGTCWSQGLWAPIVASPALVWEEWTASASMLSVPLLTSWLFLPHNPLNRPFRAEPFQVSQTTITCWSTLLAFGRKVITTAFLDWMLQVCLWWAASQKCLYCFLFYLPGITLWTFLISNKII